jgi:hypothetical protein
MSTAEISIWDLVPGDVADSMIIRSVERIDHGAGDVRLNIVGEWTNEYLKACPYLGRIIRLQYHSDTPRTIRVLNRLPRME